MISARRVPLVGRGGCHLLLGRRDPSPAGKRTHAMLASLIRAALTAYRGAYIQHRLHSKSMRAKGQSGSQRTGSASHGVMAPSPGPPDLCTGPHNHVRCVVNNTSPVCPAGHPRRRLCATRSPGTTMPVCATPAFVCSSLQHSTRPHKRTGVRRANLESGKGRAPGLRIAGRLSKSKLARVFSTLAAGHSDHLRRAAPARVFGSKVAPGVWRSPLLVCGMASTKHRLTPSRRGISR